MKQLDAFRHALIAYSEAESKVADLKQAYESAETALIKAERALLGRREEVHKARADLERALLDAGHHVAIAGVVIGDAPP